VTLEITGKSLSTEEFSAWLQNAMNNSVPRISFVIGGAWGLAPALSEKSNLKLSLSAMTFPHELARLMLTEQILSRPIALERLALPQKVGAKTGAFLPLGRT